jgi:FtsZ-binding cell division protein ZapB
MEINILNTVWEYLIIAIPTIVAILGEVAVLKKTFGTITNTAKEIKDTKEFKELKEENRKLQRELREQNKLTRELLVKIDRIQRTNPSITED